MYTYLSYVARKEDKERRQSDKIVCYNCAIIATKIKQTQSQKAMVLGS